MGKNGAGKSTLLKILAGVREPTRGKVSAPKDTVIAYLPQHLMTEDGRTVFEETAQAFAHLHEMEAEIAAINKELEIRTDYESDSYMELIERVSTLSEKFYSIEEINYDADIEKTLLGLGFTREDFGRQTSEFSGGWRMRIELAKLLLKKPDVLLLDEPTNHLDIDIIEYLEAYLQRSRCTLLMVTHDRYFLDRVCNTIFEIDRGELIVYKGNYAEYLAKREERYANMQAAIDKSRNLLRRELEWIRSTPQARTGKARYRINAFYDLKDRASVSLRTDNVEIDVASSRLGRKIINCTDVSFSYGERRMLDDFSYKFTRGEKVGIVGNNGAGKSTFLDIMTGRIAPDSGIVERGETLRIGYYRQQGITFRAGQTVLDTVKEIAEEVRSADGHTISATSYLTKFLFPPETFNKRVDILSGGEQRRLYLLTILMRNPNMLILDEPTNDLDIMTLNVLEEYLQQFEGSLLIVSHDRYFLDKTTDHLFIFTGDGHIKDFVGRYSEYREYMREEQAEQRKSAAAAEKPSAVQPQRVRKEEKRRLTYKEQRELEQIEADLSTLSDQRRALEEQLSSGTLGYDELTAISQQIEKIIEEIDVKEMRWLELSE